MKSYINDNFLLTNDTAVKLYENYAKHVPIFDFHCHLNPEEILLNKRFKNITELWLGGDHYKWRAMRSNGVEEKYITGDADDKDKFLKWAETLPYCIGNPLYVWTHLELKRYFGIDKLLAPDTAEEIWNTCNELLQKDEFTAKELIKKSKVTALCTTDDPADSLSSHIELSKDTSFDVKVLPTFRPDKALYIERTGFSAWLEKLEKAVGYKIDCYAALKTALMERIEFFNELGCRVSDHSLEPLAYVNASDTEASAIFDKAMNGATISESEAIKYKSNLMIFLGKQYHAHGWAMQLHMGAQRNNNKKMFSKLGVDSGFDAMGDNQITAALAALLNELNETEELPKTVVYSLNQKDNDAIMSIIGCFQNSEAAGKIQLGSAWWLNDNRQGMINQLTALANQGLLGRFIGMLTDSRSFVSYTRHEYFRRILCNLLGAWAEDGDIPCDIALLGRTVQNICYNNAITYFL